jgi:hypothetical protein
MSKGAVRAALVPVILGLLAYGCSRDTGGAAIVKKSSLGSFPKETVGLLVLEVRPLRSQKRASSWVEEMAEIADQEGPFRQVRDKFGMETLKKLDRVGLAIVPGADKTMDYGIVAEGSFDPSKIREALGGQDLVTLEEEQGKPDFSVAALEGGALALGPRRVLEVIRANAVRRGSGLDGNRPFLDLLMKVRPASHVWGAVDCRALGGLARESALAQGIGGSVLAKSPQANNLLSLAFQGKIGDSVEFDLLGRADAEANARTLADAARGLIAIGRIGVGQGRTGGWLEFLDGLSIEQHGTAITLHGSVSEKAMTSLAAQAQEASADRSRHGAAPAPPGTLAPAPAGPATQGPAPAGEPVAPAPAADESAVPPKP